MLPPAEIDDYRKLSKEELVARLWLAQLNICLGRTEDEAKVWLESLVLRRESWMKRPTSKGRRRKASNK
jgi:hypothetical protein